MGSGSGPYSGLDEIDLRAAAFAVGHLCRTAPSVPPSMWRLRDKLDAVVRAGLSPPRHENDGDTAGLAGVELIGTRAAAHMLGWSMRRVQRRRADLGGRYVGDSLAFDANEVRAYVAALQHEGDTDNG